MEQKLIETGVKMKPILFSTPMVQAILEGRKTMTRRVIKPQPPKEAVISKNPSRGQFEYRWYEPDPSNKYRKIKVNPKYQPGNVIWVRETWATVTKGFGFNAYEEYVYKADYRGDDTDVDWRNSMYMPKAAARIFLRVKEIDLASVQDISEADALKEGVIPENGTGRNAFRILWDQINGKREFGWFMNPWIWVIEFERVLLQERAGS